jgi:lipid-A-disaccharide synthase
MNHKILLIAGEVSADHHGAELVRELKAQDREILFYGIGGDELSKQGMELIYHSKEMAFLGITEVLKHLPFIREVHSKLMDWVQQNTPSAAILIDYPGFNLRLARSLKKMNVPVIYYISPQLWAWGKGRVTKIRKYVDLMLVLFPFEKSFYADHGIHAEYVGHPMVDKHYYHLPDMPKKVEPGKVRIGLLPGSRRQEVEALLPRMVATAEHLINAGTVSEATVVKVSHIPQEVYNQWINTNSVRIRVAEVPLNQVLPELDAVVTASGTATLEAGYFGVPTLVVYVVNRLTYWLGRLLVKVKHIGLINIVAEKEVAPELIQDAFKPEAAAKYLSRMLLPVENRRIRESLTIIRKKLGEPGASKRAAQKIRSFIEK